MPTRLFSERPSTAGDYEVRDVRAHGTSEAAAVSVDVGAWSRKGAFRAVNEDSFASSRLESSPRAGVPPFILVVADGMGGELSGQRAGRVATRSMLHSFGAAPFRKLQSSPEDVLREALVRAHLDILDDASGDPRREGMGTTLTAALVLWPLAYVIHAGDSRCYLLRRGTLKALTKDETVAAILVERGELTPEAARTSRYRHVLSNHLGGDLRLPEAQTSRLVLESWDGLLLATDGLSDVLGESELAKIASSPVSAHAVCHMLVESAAGRGARDDATALFARLGPTF